LELNKGKNRKSSDEAKMPIVHQKSMRLPVIKEEAKKKEECLKKKPKPEMIDAWTQTDRSDLLIIKQRMLL
jgi:hypothetical protein